MHSRKETGPMHFLSVKPVLMLILINWLDRPLNNNDDNDGDNDKDNNSNSKEYLGEVFRSVNEFALRTCAAVPCILNSIRRSY